MGYLKGCPGLSSKSVEKYINVERATEKGHMDQKRQGLRSTKKDVEKDEVIQDENNEKSNEVYIALEEISGKIYSDQTRKFPRIKSGNVVRYNFLCL